METLILNTRLLLNRKENRTIIKKKGIMNGCLIMQRPKEEIRQNILKAAADEFAAVGYRQASMRKIAEKSGITPGNIYAYFEGKDDLFDQVTAPTVTELARFLEEVYKGADINQNSVQQITDAVADIFIKNRKGFLILTDASAGSKHENIKGHIVDAVEKRLTGEFLPRLAPAHRHTLLARALASAIIEGLLCIFRECYDNDSLLYQGINAFMAVILSGMGLSIGVQGKG
ncbi:TetR/AcrR family transcriptional regulator [Zongyangia sp. HA2173]|uniref:TetR/AcrR family transcriptional regulator n=1 Tax=Zongyangia sp. HA2173 TaxID=3133035 RepID=UPI00315EBA2F